MNYREQQLRQILKRDYVPGEDYQTLSQEKQILQTELNQILLDVDYQLQIQTKEENQALQEALATANNFLQDQYSLVQNQEETIKGLSADLNNKRISLEKKTTFLQQFLATKQEQLRSYD